LLSSSSPSSSSSFEEYHAQSPDDGHDDDGHDDDDNNNNNVNSDSKLRAVIAIRFEVEANAEDHPIIDQLISHWSRASWKQNKACTVDQSGGDDDADDDDEDDQSSMNAMDSSTSSKSASGDNLYDSLLSPTESY